MPDYAVFGGRLRSDMEFPWLRALGAGHESDPTWTLSAGYVAPPDIDSRLIGEDVIGDGSPVRLYAETGRHLLHYAGLGSFAIERGRITYSAEPGVPDELIRLCVIGRVFATVLHLSGTACLHGGAVDLAGKGLAFLAPAGTGKSTLVRALVRSGAKHVADDSIPIEPGDPPILRPGVPAVRLRKYRVGEVQQASAEESGGHPLAAALAHKYGVAVEHAEMLAQAPVPLDAVYLLSPAAADAPSSATRTQLDGTTATLALLSNARGGALAAQSWAPELLERCAQITNGATVYRLDIARDLTRLPEAVAQIFDWHGPADEARP